LPNEALRPIHEKPIMTKSLPVVALCVVLAGCGKSTPVLNQEIAGKIHEGMSPADVRAILGAPEQSTTESMPNQGGTQTTYIYHDAKSQVIVVFQNDKVQETHGAFGH
jgi:outer membrane protein assembly factor BamE (lipoprotein component of BamABCDE complex)